MKILFLLNPEQDYGEYFLYNGLCELLGEDNIILYPFKLSYMGFMDMSYMLHNENKRGMTAPAAYVKSRKIRLYPFEEIVEEMQHIDLIVLTSPRHYPLHAMEFIKKLYGGKSPKPLAFCDFEDGDNICTDIIEEYKPQFIFKRELIRQIDNIYPLPFSACVPHLDIYEDLCKLDKTLDVFALFGNTHPLRERVIKFLLEQNLNNSYIGIDTGALPWQDEKRFHIPPLKGYIDYLKTMASAKINIIVRGHGRDTVRYWEAASFETLMLIKDPGIIIPNPYIDKVHCVYFNDIYDLREKIDYYLSHEQERKQIAEACRQHTFKYHTNFAQAAYFIDIIRDKI